MLPTDEEERARRVEELKRRYPTLQSLDELRDRLRKTIARALARQSRPPEN